MTSTLVPVGSPICRLCRGLLSSPMIPEQQIESAVSEESTGESSSKPASKTTSSSPQGESTENETDDEIISRSDEARSDSLCEAMENVAIISDNTSLYVAKQTGPSTLKTSGGVESSLGVPSETNPSDDKYLRSLAETYENALSWDTRRQVLSIMADLVPYSVLQRYLPGITEYRVKAARQHTVQHGRGSGVLISKSPRMRVDYSKLDHFLDFITSPHVILDLPFGERLLSLADGSVLETPNLIRTMIPELVVAQYTQFCKRTISYHSADLPCCAFCLPVPRRSESLSKGLITLRQMAERLSTT
ncbi:unnamed protein product [Porites evermanni]|uniref:Uncharacterized protein n=1 Tax=Porites evermanni TaxID=104178 RepID=A0ABN8Q2C6_9CNID|nr:unnamed protein product [Porites evermanni]